MEKPLYKLKEFCRLTNLTRKALLIYEKKGLLKPEIVNNQTGYRYYSTQQLQRATILAFLKNFNISISDMMLLIENKSSLKKYLKENHTRRIVLNEVEKLNQCLSALDICEKNDTVIQQSCTTRMLPSQQVFSLEAWGGADDMPLYFGLLTRFLSQNNIPSIGAPFTLYLADSTAERFHFKVCYPVAGYYESEHPDIRLENFNSCRIAAIKHLGTYELLPIIYKKLNTMLEEEKFDTTGEYIETYLVAGKRMQTDYSICITEIAAIIR